MTQDKVGNETRDKWPDSQGLTSPAESVRIMDFYDNKDFKKMFHDLNSLCLVSWGCVDINELLIYTSELGFRWYCTHQQNTGTCQTQILKDLLQKPALKLLFISSINLSNNHTDQYWLNIIIMHYFKQCCIFLITNFICSPCTECLHSVMMVKLIYFGICCLEKILA